MERKNKTIGLLILVVFIGAILWNKQLSGQAVQEFLTVSEFVEKVGASNVTVEADGSDTIEEILINRRQDLVYLSNVDPQYYQNATIKITTAELLDITQDVEGYSYVGLGNETFPFAGVFTTNSQIGMNLKLESALFQTIDGTVEDPVISEGNIQKLTYVGNKTGVLANQVIFNDSKETTFEWEATIDLEGEPSGIIQSIVNKTSLHQVVKLNMDFGDEQEIAIAANNSAGLICGEVAGNITLDISGTTLPTSITVIADNGNAGGLIGTMGMQDQSVSVITQDQVTLKNLDITGKRNVGGIVGEAYNPHIVTSTGATPEIRIGNVLVKNGTSSGGLYGALLNSQDMTIDKQYHIEKVRYENTRQTNVFGGVIGTYGATDLAVDFTVTQLNESNGVTNPITCEQTQKTTYYGGIIGEVKNTSYVKLNQVSVITNQSVTSKNKGGLIAHVGEESVIDIGTVKVEGTYDVESGGYYGGLVGVVENNATMKLSGTTNLVGQSKIHNNYGRIIGNLKWALAYAEAGWSINETGTASKIDNIGTNGDVIRNNKIGGIIQFAEDTNKVSVAKRQTNVITGTQKVASIEDFASLAISLQTQSVNNKPLKFDVQLTSDINLTGTGIYGLTRSDSFAATQTYTGRFNGTGHTIILDIGGNTGTSGAIETRRGVFNKEYIGLFGVVTDNTIFENLTMAGNLNIKQNSVSIRFGALAGLGKGDIKDTLQLSNLTISPQVGFCKTDENNKDIRLFGGSAIGEVQKMNINIGTAGGEAVKLFNASMKNTANINRNHNYEIGGFIGNITGNASTLNDRVKIQIASMEIKGTSLIMNDPKAAIAGGLLGNKWTNVDTIVSESFIVDKCELNLRHTGMFGGLLQNVLGSFLQEDEANITIQNTKLIHNDDSRYKGMLIGDARNAYISIDKDFYKLQALTLEMRGQYFDEIAGYNLDIARWYNKVCGIISIRTDSSDGKFYSANTSDAYRDQLGTGYMSASVRYYYNLETILGEPSVITNQSGKWPSIQDKNINTIQELMLWSIRNFSNIGCRYWNQLDKGTYTITGKINTTGYSYYPTSSMTNLNIQNATVVFDNATINNLSKQDKLNWENDNRNTSQQIGNHYHMHGGILYRQKYVLNVTNLTLQGSISNASDKVTGALVCKDIYGSENPRTEAVIKGVSLDGIEIYDYTKGNSPNGLLIGGITNYVNANISSVTCSGYTATDKSKKVAGSLIGNVGANTAKGINITFSDMALDGRSANSIFANASFINKFSYEADSTGSYNFTFDEAWGNNNVFEHVTYGKEITESQRNPDAQMQYYNTEDYVSTTKKNATISEAENFNNGQYLPYVYYSTGTSNETEIDVNLKKADLITGEGTYEYPYSITNARQLQLISEYFIREIPTNEWIICIDTEQQKYCRWKQGKWEIGTYQNNIFISNNTYMDEPDMRKHLLNAYYQIDNVITMSPHYEGLGTTANPFQGVIVSKTESISVRYPETSNTHTEFGGLIKVSQGAVVKDLTIQIGNKKVVKNNAQGTNTISYFGGVIGTVLGGDNIIDNVTIKQLTDTKVTLLKSKANYEKYASVGGYVGLVKSGGVIFKNMNANSADNFENFLKDEFLYTNPYIGRVLDGFAIHSNNTTTAILDNGENDYCIPTIPEKEVILEVRRKSNQKIGSITVNNENGLYMLSAIVNSGAGSNSKYNMDTAYTSTSYNNGKVRNGTYDKIGQDPTKVDVESVADEQNNNKVPYLVKHYTNAVGSFYPAINLGSNNVRYDVLFKQTSYDMERFGNGFRGIGARYQGYKSNEFHNRILHIGDVNKGNTKPVIIQYDMNVKQYKDDVFQVTSMGLFNYFMQDGLHTSEQRKVVENLYISGTNHMTRIDLLEREIQGTGDSSKKVMQGMLVGNMYTNTNESKYQSEFSNIQLSKFDMYGADYTGGMIGNLNTAYNLEIENASLNQYSMHSWGIAGGVFGNITNGTITIQDVHVTNAHGNEGYARDVIQGNIVGGIVGAINTKKNVTIQSCSVGIPTINNKSKQSLLMSGLSSKPGIILGGVIGKAIKSNGYYFTMKDVAVENVAISRPFTGSSKADGYVGGIYGQAAGLPYVMEEIRLVDNLIMGPGKVGGVIGAFTYNSGANIHNVQWIDNVLGNDLVRTPTLEVWQGGTDVDMGADNVVLKLYGNVKTYQELEKDTAVFSNTGVWTGDLHSNVQPLYITNANLHCRTEKKTITKIVDLLPTYSVANRKDRNTYAENAAENSIQNEFKGYIQYETPATPLDKLIAFYQYQYGNEYLRNYQFSHNYFYKEGTEGVVPEEIQELFTTFNGFHSLNEEEGEFPVLVVESNNAQEVTDMLKGYLDIVLENGFSEVYNSSGWKRGNAPSNIDITSYRLDEYNTTWMEEDIASLMYDQNSSNYFRVIPGQWDNDKRRVTVLELAYNIKRVGADGSMVEDTHIVEIPIVVKQIIDVEFSATVHEGTNFNLESYDKISQKTLSTYGEKYTTLLEYRYPDYDWINYLENGGNLLWNYQKEIHFTGRLPAQSELTLVDLNNENQKYTFIVPEGGCSSVQLEAFVKNSFQQPESTMKMQTMSFNSLLKLKVTESDSGKWVAVNNQNDGTISSGEQWYRLATPHEIEDDRIKKYRIQLPEDNFTPVEQYYLTVKTPRLEEKVEVGLGIDHRTTFVKRDYNDPVKELPYEIQETSEIESTCIIYQPILQNFTTESASNILLDSQGDTIVLEYENNISCTEEYYKFIQNKGQRFLEISLAPVLTSLIENSKNNIPFAAPIKATVQFDVYNSKGNVITEEYVVDYKQPINQMSFLLGDGTEAYNLISGFERIGNTDDFGCTVDTTITLDIPEVAIEMFPYSDINNVKEYVELKAKSKIAVQEDSFRTTEGMQLDKWDKYYRNRLDMASLHYSVNDKTTDLGVNSLNLEKPNEPQQISTIAVYNTELINEETWNNVEQIQCELSFYNKTNKKGDKIRYEAVPEGWLGKYLNITLEDGTIQGNGKVLTNNKFILERTDENNFEGYYHTESKQVVFPLELYVEPNLHTINGKYSNYMVAIHVTLLDKNGAEILPEKVDYIRYTHANIPTQIVRKKP